MQSLVGMMNQAHEKIHSAILAKYPSVNLHTAYCVYLGNAVHYL